MNSATLVQTFSVGYQSQRTVFFSGWTEAKSMAIAYLHRCMQ